MADEEHEWLDPQTRAILCKNPPKAPATISAGAYSLLVLELGSDHARIEEAVTEIRRDAGSSLTRLPFVIAQGLSMENALAGQFALACCDCPAVFIPDEAVNRADAAWLRQLYVQAMSSEDFQSIRVELLSVPLTDAGHRFCWQFLGLATGLALPTTFRVMRLKAELMEHWAKKVGAVIQLSSRAGGTSSSAAF